MDSEWLPEEINSLDGEAGRLTYASMQRAGPLRVTTTGSPHRQGESSIRHGKRATDSLSVALSGDF